MLGLDQQVSWNMGFTCLLLMFAAITLGGLGNPFGALVGRWSSASSSSCGPGCSPRPSS